jgi:5-methylcytosine-specific restriction endonuclease McrA
MKKRVTTPEQNKKNYQKHKEKRLKSFQDYYLTNKEKIKERQKKYRQDNKEFINLRNRKRKELISGGNVSREEIKQLKESSNNQCLYCKSPDNLQIDHYVPLAKGGSHHISNLVIACRRCNLAKSDKMPEEWLKIININ